MHSSVWRNDTTVSLIGASGLEQGDDDDVQNWGVSSSLFEPSTTAFPAVVDRQWTAGCDAVGPPSSEVRPGAVTVTGSLMSSVDLPLSRVRELVYTISYPAGVARTFAYDDLGRPTDYTTLKAPATRGRRQYTYNSDRTLQTQTGPSDRAFSGIFSVYIGAGIGAGLSVDVVVFRTSTFTPPVLF